MEYYKKFYIYQDELYFNLASLILMSNLFSSVLLVFLALPLPVFRIPLSTMVFFAYFTILAFGDVYKSKLSLSIKLITAYMVLLVLLFARGTPLDGIDSVLALIRYFSAFIPILLLPSLHSFALNNKLQTRHYLCILSITFLFLGIWSVLPLSQCVSSYGGECILSQDSSSFGAFASITIATFSFYVCGFPGSPFLKLVSILNSVLYLYLGAIQGARMFWLLVAFTLLFLLFHELAAVLARRKITINKFFRYSIVSSALFCLTYLATNLYSFGRVISFLPDTISDHRIENGYLLGSKLSLSFSEFFLGKSLFSQLSGWDGTSGYDSSVNLLLSDFGVIGGAVVVSLASVSILSVLRSSMTNISRLYCNIIISVYVIANITNEFIFLKGANPLFITLLSLISVGYAGINSDPPSRLTQEPSVIYKR